jgi:hypothetical protein
MNPDPIKATVVLADPTATDAGEMPLKMGTALADGVNVTLWLWLVPPQPTNSSAQQIKKRPANNPVFLRQTFRSKINSIRS